MGVLQSKPVINSRLLCPNALVTGTTAFVRATNQSVSGSLLYSIGFTATDTGQRHKLHGRGPGVRAGPPPRGQTLHGHRGVRRHQVQMRSLAKTYSVGRAKRGSSGTRLTTRAAIAELSVPDGSGRI
jgi:hypothetical protein